MSSDLQPEIPSKGRLWTGIILSGIVVAFLIFDGATKIIQTSQVREAMAKMGYPEYLAPILGSLLLLFVILYLIPRASVLGALLITAYLGGAVDAQLHSGAPPSYLAFPIVFCVITWAGLFLRRTHLSPAFFRK